jgi:hypothetical protein
VRGDLDGSPSETGTVESDSARRMQDSIMRSMHPLATPQRRNTSIPLMH